MLNKPKIIIPGTIKKILKPLFSVEPEKVEIVVQGTDGPYRIRIENAFESHDGTKVKLKEGASVSITVEAEPDQTTPQE